jgi:hypothetical protein
MYTEGREEKWKEKMKALKKKHKRLGYMLFDLLKVNDVNKKKIKTIRSHVGSWAFCLNLVQKNQLL